MTGSSINITATPPATAQTLIAEFASAFAPTANPIFATISGRGSAVVSPSSMQFYIQVETSPGVWNDWPSLPFHVAETSAGTRAHWFT